jgi:hypothetical protein
MTTALRTLCAFNDEQRRIIQKVSIWVGDSPFGGVTPEDPVVLVEQGDWVIVVDHYGSFTKEQDLFDATRYYFTSLLKKYFPAQYLN